MKAPKKLDKAGSVYWRKLFPEVEQGGSGPGRLQILESVCQELSLYDQTIELVKQHGLLVNTGAGGLKNNPVLASKDKAFANAMQGLKLLGLNASQVLAELDEMDEYQSGGK